MMMTGPQKSDGVIVPVKVPNKSASAEAEALEGRTPTRERREAKARTGLRAGQARHKRLTGYGRQPRGDLRNVLRRCCTMCRWRP